MPSSSHKVAPLPPHHLSKLIVILRRANARYTDVATSIRTSFTPTRHAKTRARNLGLTIDVVAAVNCPHKQVSVIPLPIIEVVTPPVINIRPQASSVAPKRPLLSCSSPQVVQTITSPNGTTSALSTGSVYSITSAQTGNANVRSHWSAITDDDGLFPRDATDIDSSNVRAAEQAEPPAVWQPIDVHIDEDPIVWEMDLKYPEDPSSMDLCTSPSSGSEAGSESSDTSNSSASSSFSGPVTPPDAKTLPPLMLRIKRKSIEIRDNDNDMADKRMKIHQIAQRRNIIRIPARKVQV